MGDGDPDLEYEGGARKWLTEPLPGAVRGRLNAAEVTDVLTVLLASAYASACCAGFAVWTGVAPEEAITATAAVTTAAPTLFRAAQRVWQGRPRRKRPAPDPPPDFTD